MYYTPYTDETGILLSVILVLGGEMTHLNRKDSRYVITATATIFTLAIMTASIMPTAPAIATTTTTATATTTSPESE